MKLLILCLFGIVTQAVAIEKAGCYANWGTDNVTYVQNSQGCDDYCSREYSLHYKGYCQHAFQERDECICEPVGCYVGWGTDNVTFVQNSQGCDDYCSRESSLHYKGHCQHAFQERDECICEPVGCYVGWGTDNVTFVQNSQGCDDYCSRKYEGFKGYCQHDFNERDECICKPGGCFVEWGTDNVTFVQNSQGCDDYCSRKYEGFKGYCQHDFDERDDCICKPVGCFAEWGTENVTYLRNSTGCHHYCTQKYIKGYVGYCHRAFEERDECLCIPVGCYAEWGYDNVKYVENDTGCDNYCSRVYPDFPKGHCVHDYKERDKCICQKQS